MFCLTIPGGSDLSPDWLECVYRLPAVSCQRDQPHAQVGGRLEGARLFGSQHFLCRARRERPLFEIRPFGIAWTLIHLPGLRQHLVFHMNSVVSQKEHVSAASAQSNSSVFFSTRCQSIQEILPYFPAEVPYCGSARLVVSRNAKPTGERSFPNTDPACRNWLATQEEMSASWKRMWSCRSTDGSSGTR